MDYLNVAAGERVLILTEHLVDPVVIQATAAAAAYRGADVHVLSVPPFQKKARMVSVSQTATAASFVTAARFPADLYYAICSKARERLASCTELRITTERGTDVTAVGCRKSVRGSRRLPRVFVQQAA